MFAREGYALIIGSVLLALVLILFSLLVPTVWRYILSFLGILLVAFTLYFFRDPDRVPPPQAANGTLLLAPADGKVVLVEQVEEPLYLKGPATQVSIFLSPLNVHVNRIPADGVIELVDYIPGDYLVAWHEKASELNERSILGLRHPSGIPVLFKQIAGFVARRIVFHVQKGDRVKAGERFGIVKFGSRMDVLVPPEVDVVAKVGDRVTAGETILGYLPNAVSDSAQASVSSATITSTP